MVLISAATSRRPLRSRRLTISPARPRSTPSGFTMTRVRSTRVRDYTTRTGSASGFLPGCARCQSVGAGGTDHVERAGDDDEAVRVHHPARHVYRVAHIGFFVDGETQGASGFGYRGDRHRTR